MRFILRVFLIIGVTHSAFAWQQIPFGFFRGSSSVSSFSDSFEAIGNPPTGWSVCTNSIGGATVASNPSEGTRSLLLQVSYYDTWIVACLERTMDLTGLNTLTLDITNISAISSTGLTVRIDGSIVATWNTTGAKSVSISGHSGPSKTLRLQIDNTGNFPDEDIFYIDNLNIAP